MQRHERPQNASKAMPSNRKYKEVSQPSEFENSNFDHRDVTTEREKMAVKSLDTFVLKQGITKVT